MKLRHEASSGQIWQRAICAVGLGIGWFAGSQAALAEDLLHPSLRACAAETDDVRRLACYDREIARLSASPEEQFGVRGEVAGRANDKAPELDRLTAKVMSISSRPHGELVITLDNGQVWAQKESRYIPLKVGDTVTIRSGAFGSLWLDIPSTRSSTRVKREK